MVDRITAAVRALAQHVSHAPTCAIAKRGSFQWHAGDDQFEPRCTCDREERAARTLGTWVQVLAEAAMECGWSGTYASELWQEPEIVRALETPQET